MLYDLPRLKATLESILFGCYSLKSKINLMLTVNKIDVTNYSLHLNGICLSHEAVWWKMAIWQLQSDLQNV